jgi:endo-1,4-beta-xylanase
MPSSGGAMQCTSNGQGTADALSWTVWSSGSGACMTTYNNATAFSATWNNSQDFLARLGLALNGAAYSSLGTITAEFAENRTGSAGGYSSIGIYGWSESGPCVEFYIVDDSYNGIPTMSGAQGSAVIDGATYNFYSINTSGTAGANACSGSVSQWKQYWSVRQTQRQCGTISVSQHFAAWAAKGMTLGNMLQAQISVEVGGGQGTINFPTASMTMQ